MSEDVATPTEVQKKPVPIQMAIDFASAPIQESWKNFKAAKQGYKRLIKNIQVDLQESDPDYSRLIEEEKRLKKRRKDMNEELADMKHQKELMIMNADNFEEASGMLSNAEQNFHQEKEKATNYLSEALEKNGLRAEVGFKSGDLTLVVSRSK